jgi:N-methylhydantoinase B
MTEHTTFAHQIMWDRLISVVEEQAQALVRSSFCTAVREGGDLSAGVFDRAGRMLAQAVTGTPGHVNSMANGVKHFLAKFPIETMQEGDAFITNDPWFTSGHLHDFTIVTPVFLANHAVAMFAATVHVVDVGGRGYIAECRQVFEEGICIPVMRLVKSGALNEELLDIIRGNVREPQQVVGDIVSIVGSNEHGARQLLRMMAEFGLPDLEGLGNTILESSERATRADIARLRPGRYCGSLLCDGFDELVKISALVTVSPHGVHVDYDGTSPASPFGINVVMNYTEAYTTYGIKCAVSPDVPNNAGAMRLITASAPEGCILNAPRPWPVAARHVIGHMLPDLLFEALQDALPDGLPAESGMTWNPQIRGGATVAGSGPDFEVFMINSGGMGARPDKDGLNATAFPSGVHTTPVEVTESVAPIRIWRKELRDDSGGAGRRRGGLGQSIEISGATNAPILISTMVDRVQTPVRGRRSGGDGGVGRLALRSGPELHSKGQHMITAGDRLCLDLPGGGGHGDAYLRDPEEVAADVIAGYVSPEMALRQYGVVVTAEGTVDVALTLRERNRGRADR